MRTYTLTVAGLTRELPLCQINDRVDIAAFVIFSDVEMTIACASELLKKVPDFDVILTAESKGIPLAYEASRQCGKNYFVARKGLKLYMTDPLSVEVTSITTDHVQSLYLPQEDIERIKGKKVLLLDDVISTGKTLSALVRLAEDSEGIVAGKASVLAEGVAADRDDIIFLEKLPVFIR